jgi:hypothetical protein
MLHLYEGRACRRVQEQAAPEQAKKMGAVDDERKFSVLARHASAPLRRFLAIAT